MRKRIILIDVLTKVVLYIRIRLILKHQARGILMSKYEREILELINASDRHMTSEEIFLLLKEKEPKIVLATVYNNLKKLVDEHQIMKLSFVGQPDRYDKLYKHDHLICSVCGSISDYNFTDLTASIEKELGVAIDSYDLRISYVCPACRKKS